MKTLRIQMQPALVTGLDAALEAERLRRIIEASGLAGPVRVAEGDEAGPYINLDFQTAEVAAVWSCLRHEWRPGSSLVRCSIVCCEGDAGWDDYRLLHHYDPSESLDECGNAEPDAVSGAVQ